MIGRREWLAGAAATLVAQTPEPVIDIHQHTNYSGRSNEELVQHQRDLGITKTVLLPAGSKYGLAADAGGNDTVIALAKQYPKEYVYFANELPDIPETRAVITKVLRGGAIGIGEQKFYIETDSAHIDLIASIAREFKVPVLMHFEHGRYNVGIDRFHKTLAKYKEVNFIGHAQTWWGNIDKAHDQTVLYPTGKVTPGGITDRLLSDYPNMFGDLSAGSGVNALSRDEEHAREFLKRHQDKLMFGSDCSDRKAHSERCLGSKQLANVRRFAPDPKVRRKILYENAARVIRIK